MILDARNGMSMKCFAVLRYNTHKKINIFTSWFYYFWVPTGIFLWERQSTGAHIFR
ncbi:hypothetical protein HNR56_002632 [Roseospira marina]|nr:hypothetical protein [Roseospira marina]MBB5087932.1 hypothetical protein [Roseospira marina]